MRQRTPGTTRLPWRTRTGPNTFEPTVGKRRLPVGAEVLENRGVHFRVWAPRSKAVTLQLGRESGTFNGNLASIELKSEGNGYFSAETPLARPGMLYKFQLDSGAFPDPASRFQPEGPHGPSAIVDPRRFRWTDAEWQGAPRAGRVIYEMHIGTFTREGTWRAAVRKLRELAALGVNLLEIMPVADFPGGFGWGYDGVNLFAPTRLYGRPDDVRAFVNRAHALGLGVILDVVYNHFGPDGNYLREYSREYLTDRHANEWGDAINFDGERSGPVREFFIANARHWIEEYHLDGLRLDATQQIFDGSRENILAAIGRAVRRAAGKRETFIAAENEPQQVRLMRPIESGGFGLDALWNDDFHHAAIVALTGRNEAYYSDYRGVPQEFISAVKWGFLYQGQRYAWQKKRRGTPTVTLGPEQFVNFLQNHDQIANSLSGARLHQLTSPGRLRAITALLLLGPGTPMLFQGQEFAASTPFLYFADHNPELAKVIAVGRRKFLEQFRSIAHPESAAALTAPESRSTFLHCKLRWSERRQHQGIYALHRDLLKLRHDDPVFSNPRPRGVDGAVLGREAFALRFFGPDHNDRLLLVNLGIALKLRSAPEPLLAPVEERVWKLKWSSENPRYGGGGMPPVEVDGAWFIPGHAAVVVAAEDGS